MVEWKHETLATQMLAIAVGVAILIAPICLLVGFFLYHSLLFWTLYVVFDVVFIVFLAWVGIYLLGIPVLIIGDVLERTGLLKKLKAFVHRASAPEPPETPEIPGNQP